MTLRKPEVKKDNKPRSGRISVTELLQMSESSLINFLDQQIEALDSAQSPTQSKDKQSASKGSKVGQMTNTFKTLQHHKKTPHYHTIHLLRKVLTYGRRRPQTNKVGQRRSKVGQMTNTLGQRRNKEKPHCQFNLQRN